jgi:hypothetical protein
VTRQDKSDVHPGFVITLRHRIRSEEESWWLIPYLVGFSNDGHRAHLERIHRKIVLGSENVIIVIGGRKVIVKLFGFHQVSQ